MSAMRIGTGTIWETGENGKLEAKRSRKTRKTSDWDAANNKDVGHFVLLATLMEDAGLCGADIKICLAKYINYIEPRQYRSLRSHLPHINGKDLKDMSSKSNKWVPGLEGISRFRGDNLTVDALQKALNNTIVKIESDPTAFDEWVIGVAKACATKVSYDNPDKKRKVTCDPFWFSELENALFLSSMIRMELLPKARPEITDSFTISPKIASIRREAWFWFFGPEIFFNEWHFMKACTCRNKSVTLNFELYTTGLSPTDNVKEMEEKLKKIRMVNPRPRYGKDHKKTEIVISPDVFYQLHWENVEFMGLWKKYLQARKKTEVLTTTMSSNRLLLIATHNATRNYYKGLEEIGEGSMSELEELATETETEP
ncbi:hypothetical protein B0H63DRAFT_524478 [Podospora didyma]|uniref:Uncharacterized protein n=1 Tax=Podospora didyma TaxID=330526 RepID=A0AAE0NHT2_9PEZI|nr:hypothetical protein B0H63DRAFT_524478 [Podospora didyma]